MEGKGECRKVANGPAPRTYPLAVADTRLYGERSQWYGRSYKASHDTATMKQITFRARNRDRDKYNAVYPSGSAKTPILNIVTADAVHDIVTTSSTFIGLRYCD